MAHFKTTQDDSILTQEDWRKIYGRMNDTIMPKAPPKVREVWANCKALGARQGKFHQQRTIVKAWLVDNTF
eukprot:10957122-Alexandrium_andersonii.AAC.1